MTKRELKCPKCSQMLEIAVEGAAEVDVCPACRGIWVDAAEEKAVLQIRPEVFSIDELRRLRSIYEPLGRIDPVKYVPCPLCAQLMNRKTWGSHSGVVVDRCLKHGTWFDADEMEKIREYIAAGGIEFEKLRLTERGLSDVNSKLVTEISRVDRRIDSAYRRARIFSQIGF